MANRQRRIGAIDPVEQAGIESFPASDPPGWVPLRSGSPSRSANLRDLRRQKRAAPEIASASKAVAAPLGELRHRAPRRYAARRKRSA